MDEDEGMVWCRRSMTGALIRFTGEFRSNGVVKKRGLSGGPDCAASYLVCCNRDFNEQKLWISVPFQMLDAKEIKGLISGL